MRYFFWLFLFVSVAHAGSEIFFVSNVNTVDVETGTVLPAQDLVIERGVEVRRAGHGLQAIPPGANVIDASGKYLIPGLWDMHVHVWLRDIDLPLYTANGVTGVREMGSGNVELLMQWANDTEAGKIVGPKIVAAGPIIDGADPFWPGSVSLAKVEEVAPALAEIKAKGSAFFKTYSLLTPDVFFNIAKESQKLGVPFAGHVPLLVKAQEASQAGMKSIEHFTNVLLGCSTEEDAIITHRKQTGAGSNRASYITEQLLSEQKILNSFNAEKAKTLADVFAKNGTHLVPTLSVLRIVPTVLDSSVKKNPNLKYVPKEIKSGWDKIPAPSPIQVAMALKRFAREQSLIPLMSKSGVRFLPGTDTGNPYIIPGFSLHDELKLLVDAGLSTKEVLYAATLGAERWVAIQSPKANLVLLNGNPLQNISETKNISAVFSNGRYFSRSELDKILSDIEKLARESRNRSASIAGHAH